MKRRIACGLFLALAMVWTGEAVTPFPREFDLIRGRFGTWLNMTRDGASDTVSPSIELLRQDYERLERNQSVLKTPLRIGSERFSRGLGTHATSHIRVRLPKGAERFTTKVGIDNNHGTQGKRGGVVFIVMYCIVCIRMASR